MTEENTVKPYSEAEYARAVGMGLDLDCWSDYEEFYEQQSAATEQNYLEELFRDYTVSEADKVTYDWGETEKTGGSRK